MFSNAAPQAKGWVWIMGPAEPIGAMRRASRFAFINWEHELNIGPLPPRSVMFRETCLASTESVSPGLQGFSFEEEQADVNIYFSLWM
jgi:hypothetical protein